MSACKKFELAVGNVLTSNARHVSCSVTKVSDNSTTMDCVKYWNLGDLTMFMFNTFKNLEKSYGVQSCNFVLPSYGIVKIDSNSSEQKIYSRLLAQQK